MIVIQGDFVAMKDSEGRPVNTSVRKTHDFLGRFDSLEIPAPEFKHFRGTLIDQKRNISSRLILHE